LALKELMHYTEQISYIRYIVGVKLWLGVVDYINRRYGQLNGSQAKSCEEERPARV
jgi:hypothetical protein